MGFNSGFKGLKLQTRRREPDAEMPTRK